MISTDGNYGISSVLKINFRGGGEYKFLLDFEKINLKWEW
jgi:hypothetical protein